MLASSEHPMILGATLSVRGKLACGIVIVVAGTHRVVVVAYASMTFVCACPGFCTWSRQLVHNRAEHHRSTPEDLRVMGCDATSR